MFHTRALAPLASIGFLVISATAGAAKRAPCPDAGYVVGAPLLPGEGDSDLLTVAGRTVCTPGRVDCFGDGGLAGLKGTGAPGGSACFVNGNPGGPQGARGTDGDDGDAGAVGGPGTPGAASDPECSAGGASCSP